MNSLIRSLMPLLLVAAAVGLFYVFTYDEQLRFRALLAERAEYEESLNQYATVEQMRNVLTEQMNSLSREESEKLQKIVPNTVDNIRLFLDMQEIAARFRMGVANIQVGGEERASGSRGVGAIGPSNSQTGTITLSFTTVASYENLVAFLKELERSLRIVEIKALSFEVGSQPNSYQVNISLDTFWLRGNNSIIIP